MKRVQASLIIDDTELYENFILGLKENKELNSLIIKLLSAYYYNQEVQALVEGIELVEDEDILKTNEAFEKIRMTLSMQDYLVSELKSTLSEGVSSMEVLSKTEEKIREVQNMSDRELDSHIEENIQKQEEVQQEKDNDSKVVERLGKLEQVVDRVLNLLEQQVGGGIENEVSLTTNTVKENDYVEERPTTRVSNVSNVSKIEQVEQVPVYEQVEQVEEKDATELDILDDLFGEWL